MKDNLLSPSLLGGQCFADRLKDRAANRMADQLLPLPTGWSILWSLITLLCLTNLLTDWSSNPSILWLTFSQLIFYQTDWWIKLSFFPDWLMSQLSGPILDQTTYQLTSAEWINWISLYCERPASCLNDCLVCWLEVEVEEEVEEEEVEVEGGGGGGGS